MRGVEVNITHTQPLNDAAGEPNSELEYRDAAMEVLSALAAAGRLLPNTEHTALGSPADRAQDDLADRLARALADAAGLGNCRQVPHEDRVIAWEALLAEHADRAVAEGWEREADRLDAGGADPVAGAAS